MALIVTPGQLKRKGEFYLQLASMTSAGVTITQGIDLLRRNAPSRALKQTAEQVMQGLLQGQTFTESLQQTGRDVPEFDVGLIEAGEAAGRLDQCFRLLGNFYVERGQLASRVITQLLYPIFLLHMAFFIFPINLFTDLLLKSGGFGPFVIDKIMKLAPLYLLILFLFWLFRSNRGEALRSGLERVINVIPVLRALRRDLALARLCAALEALINAGVTIIEAWDMAGKASGSPRIIRAVAAARPNIVQGELPSDAIENQGIYPDLFITSYRTGEVSGQLDDALRRLYRHYQDAASDGLKRFAEWLPRIIFLGVAIAIGFYVISFYSNYFGEIDKVMQP
jgi:type II secretory pathway component PulF